MDKGDRPSADTEEFTKNELKADGAKKEERKKESLSNLIKIAHQNIEERQNKIKPSKSQAILNRLSTNVPLTPRDKVYAVTFGSRYLTPEERLKFDGKKKDVAKYGIVVSFVALASGLMGGLFSRRFIKAKLITQYSVFFTLFSASAYFQMYPIINDYTNFASNLFANHQHEILPFLAKQHQAYQEEQKNKDTKKTPKN